MRYQMNDESRPGENIVEKNYYFSQYLDIDTQPMHKLKQILVFFVILLTILPTKASVFCSTSLSADTLSTGISQDENILYNMINDMRVQNKLPTIPLSH